MENMKLSASVYREGECVDIIDCHSVIHLVPLLGIVI